MRLRVLLAVAAVVATPFAATADGATVVAIFTIAGGDADGFAGDGKPATAAKLNGPAGVAASRDGSVIVADTINQRIRRIAPNGRITTIAGNGKRGFAGDGGPATAATLQDPTALALAGDGSLFVADTGNDRVRVIKTDGTIATVAGAADQGFSGDGGPATRAQLDAPAGLATDTNGQLFIADTGNNRVRVLKTDGTIATVAGTGATGSAGDGGPGIAAQLNTPTGLALARDGSLLIADSGNNRVRRVAPGGTITTVAGNGGGGSGGDGGPATAAQLNLPVDVASAPKGGFFIVEQGGNRVRRVDTSGNIARLAGTGAPRYGGDGSASATSYLNAPRAAELLPSGIELVIADSDNNRIRYVAIPGQASRLALSPLAASLRLPLDKTNITVQKRKRRILTVRDKAIPLELTQKAAVTLMITAKRGKPIATVTYRARPGRNDLHLPTRLRRGRHRLAKGHYVVGVTAKAGTATAKGSLELVVK